MLSSLLALICIAGIYIPAVIVADPLGFSAPEQYSLTWFLEQAAFPEIYTATVIIYLATIGPFVVFSALKEFKKWPIVLAWVGSVFFLAVNLFWGSVILFGSEASIAVKMTVWGWIYLGVQLLSIVNLIVFAVKFKKNCR